MSSWDFSAPEEENIGDKEVKLTSDKLLGLRIAWLITGSIAAYRSPDMIRDLRRYGAEIQVFVSSNALQFVTEKSLAWASNKKIVSSLTDDSEHLGSDNMYHLYLCIPATYNCINKFSLGVADNPITTILSSALGYLEEGKSHIILSPCMHRSMHNSILKANLKILRNKGINIIQPVQEENKDKLISSSVLIEEIIKLRKKKSF